MHFCCDSFGGDFPKPHSFKEESRSGPISTDKLTDNLRTLDQASAQHKITIRHLREILACSRVVKSGKITILGSHTKTLRLILPSSQIQLIIELLQYFYNNFKFSVIRQSDICVKIHE